MQSDHLVTKVMLQAGWPSFVHITKNYVLMEQWNLHFLLYFI